MASRANTKRARAKAGLRKRVALQERPTPPNDEAVVEYRGRSLGFGRDKSRAAGRK